MGQWVKSIHWTTFEDVAPIGEIYRCLILKWVVVWLITARTLHGLVSSDGNDDGNHYTDDDNDDHNVDGIHDIMTVI